MKIHKNKNLEFVSQSNELLRKCYSKNQSQRHEHGNVSNGKNLFWFFTYYITLLHIIGWIKGFVCNIQTFFMTKSMELKRKSVVSWMQW